MGDSKSTRGSSCARRVCLRSGPRNLGATHFRSLAPDMGDCCGSRQEEPKRPGSKLVQEEGIKKPRSMPNVEYRCSNSEEDCSSQCPAPCSKRLLPSITG